LNLSSGSGVLLRSSLRSRRFSMPSI
jgi:hypothetical protein